ncbi:MAG: hypothetical protein CL851_04030 [Crocinitomicaceae bacterium]|nr:hypothetical protein [Crocinitomicaceae bacterium]
MFNQKLFSIIQVIAQSLFSFIFLSTLIKSGSETDYVSWSVSIAIVSAVFSLNIFSGVLFNKFIASGDYNTNIIFLNIFGILIIVLLTLTYGLYTNSDMIFYLAVLFASMIQISSSLCNIVDGLGKIINRCIAQIIIFTVLSFIFFFIQKLNISMLLTLTFAIFGYFLISVACIFIITINKKWSLSVPRNNWSTLVSQNSYAIAGSVTQSWIEPFIKYNLLALGGTHLIVLFDVSTRIASTIRTLIVSINTPLISIWSQKYSQSSFNKELIINMILGTVSNTVYFFTSSTIFAVFFGVSEQNLLFTTVIILTYFLVTIQNLPNISNIVLNKINRNFYGTLIVFTSVLLGYFFVFDAEIFIWSYLIGYTMSTVYLFSMKR